jgi:hypothetical protein
MSSGYYRPSPIGEAIHPWLTKPDTKFNPDGLFKTRLAVEGALAATMKEEITKASDEALQRHIETKEMKPVEAKKWSAYYPFEDETDEDGNPTGRTIFQFKQNAKIRLADGSEKKFVIGLRDSQDKVVKKGVNIFDGTKLRVMYKPRDIVMTGLKQVGVRLDFSMVQIIELSKGGGSKGFGAVDGGGFTADEAPDHNDQGSEDAEY